MRAVWVNEGTYVQSFDRLRQLGVTHIFLSARSHTRAEVDKVYAEGFVCGLYTNPQWYGFDLNVPQEPGLTKVQSAAKANRIRLSRRVTEMGGDARDMPCQINMEKLAAISEGLHDGGAEYIKQWFYWWRRVRQNRWTSWTMEGFQGGWYTTTLTSDYIRGAVLTPQAYDGNMVRWDSFGVTKDLTDWGVHPSKILPFYPVKELYTRGAEGFFYQEHNLYE